MTNHFTVDPYSVCTMPICMRFESTELSIGTAFGWEEEKGKEFLITNWHNLTGIDPNTGRNLSKTGGRPDNVLVYFTRKDNAAKKFAAPLKLKDASGSPNWLVHPQEGKSVDAVALPLNLSQDAEWLPINKLSGDSLAVEIGHDLFILGYPFGIGPLGLPVWKRASIASEPQVSLPNQRYVLVDTASRPGMSGSPVIRRSWGAHRYAEGGMTIDQGVATSFFGIYSGRLSTSDPLDAQLGLVWPAHLVRDIVLGGRRDTETV